MNGAGTHQYDGNEPFVQVTVNLGNPSHVDVHDEGRSHAVWCRKEPLRKEPTSWFFLLPDVGLAVRLRHGTMISWDGRAVRHCSAVPHGLASCDALYSYFMSLNTPTQLAKGRRSDFLLAVAAKAEGHVHCFEEGSLVWVRWDLVQGRFHTWRRRTGYVSIGIDTKLTVRFFCGVDAGKPYVYEFSDDRVVLAGRISDCNLHGPHGTSCLCGLKVKVYWSSLDACFEGVVESYHPELGGAHTVRYAADHLEVGVLGGEDTPFYRVM